MSTTEYRGSAELLDGNGNVVDTVQVFLRSTSATKMQLGKWGGHIERTTFEGGAWDNVTRIRLRDNSEGDIIITNVMMRGDQQGAARSATIAGSGPPPF